MYGCRNIIVRFCFDLYKFVMRVIKYGEWFGIKYEIIFVFYFFFIGNIFLCIWKVFFLNGVLMKRFIYCIDVVNVKMNNFL